LTAPFLPPVASRPKPPRRRQAFPTVTGSQLASVPGRRGLPLLGILPEAVLDPLAFARRMYERYGPIHRFYACGNWNVQLVGPEANEFVLFDQAGNFSAEGGWRPVFGRHFDGGLLLRDGADHQWHRKLVASAFKQDQLQAYLDIFARNNARAVAEWSGRTVDIYEFAQRLTFANGYAAFLGREPSLATRDDLLAFRYLMRSATSVIPVPIPGTAEARAVWAKRHVERLIRRAMAENIEAERKDLLAVLTRMRNDGSLDETEVIAHLTFVIAASFDTLSSATVSTLYYLAKHSNWQSTVRDELLGLAAATSGVAVGDLLEAPVSEAAMKEALRLNAPAPVLWRRATREYSFGGHAFPAGTITGVNPMLTHILPEVWDRPLEYDPRHFDKEAEGRRNRFSFIPFGTGAHACLGARFASLQLKALLVDALRGHVVEAEGPPPKWYHWPNCRPRRPLLMTLSGAPTR
jgi:cytochrome P450